MTDENKPTERPSFYAVIPAEIRYDQTLPPRAILMYGEISALCNFRGMCTAGNKYFARLYGITPRTVSDLIGQLEARGYIRTEVLRDAKNAVDERRIWLNAKFASGASVSTGEEQPPMEENFYRGRKKSLYPMEKNLQENITSKNNNNPIAPKDVLETLSAYAGQDKELAAALMGFAEARKKLRKPIATERTAQLLTGKLDRLSGGRAELKVQMLDEATEKGWTTVYPPKDTVSAPARVIETEEVPDLD